METKNKPSWAAEQRRKQNLNTARIRRVIGKNETQMFWFCFNAGMIFLRRQCNGDTWGIDMLKGESFYWKWWRNQWRLRDEQFIAQYSLWHPDWNDNTEKETKLLLAAYEQLHKSSFTNKAMASGYEQILSQVVDREVRVAKPAKKLHTYEHFLITK